MIVGLRDSINEEILGKIIAKWDFERKQVKEKFSYENFLYEVDTGTNQYFLRISHSKYKSKNAIQAEIEWIYFLSNNGVNVVLPVKSQSHQYIEIMKSNDYDLFAVVFHRIDGQNFTEDLELLSVANIKTWGRTVAKLHTLSKDYKPKIEEIHRQHWHDEMLVVKRKEILTDSPTILTYLEEVLNDLEKLPRTPDDYGLIHQDLHEANMIMNGEKIWIIDFDDCQYDWYISDIAIIFFHYAWRFKSEEKDRNQLIREFAPIFMQGYQEVNPLSDDHIKRIPLFLTARHLRLYLTIAYELGIDEDDFSRKLLNVWKPMLEKREEWISHEIILETLLQNN